MTLRSRTLQHRQLPARNPRRQLDSSAGPTDSMGKLAERPPATAAATATTAAAATTATVTAAATQRSVRELRADFASDVELRRLKEAVADLALLLDQDPKASQDRNLRRDVVELSQRIMQASGREPEELFALITQRMGTTGIDILFEALHGEGRLASRTTSRGAPQQPQHSRAGYAGAAYCVRFSCGPQLPGENRALPAGQTGRRFSNPGSAPALRSHLREACVERVLSSQRPKTP